jgi:hypothetical protein
VGGTDWGLLSKVSKRWVAPIGVCYQKSAKGGWHRLERWVAPIGILARVMLAMRAASLRGGYQECGPPSVMHPSEALRTNWMYL